MTKGVVPKPAGQVAETGEAGGQAAGYGLVADAARSHQCSGPWYVL